VIDILAKTYQFWPWVQQKLQQRTRKLFETELVKTNTVAVWTTDKNESSKWSAIIGAALSHDHQSLHIGWWPLANGSGRGHRQVRPSVDLKINGVATECRINARINYNRVDWSLSASVLCWTIKIACVHCDICIPTVGLGRVTASVWAQTSHVPTYASTPQPWLATM